jgi:exonuclease III
VNSECLVQSQIRIAGNRARISEPSRYTVRQLKEGMLNFLSLMLWNCHGIMNLFNMDSDQISIFKSFNIICICETWETREIKTVQFLDEYQVVCKQAVRTSEFGRASGGIIILTKGLKIQIMESNEFFVFMHVRHEHFKLILGFCYFPPSRIKDALVELNIFLEANKEFFSELPVLVVGDFNSRVGNLELAYDSNLFECTHLSHERFYLDTVKTRNGVRLTNIMSENSLFLINGRSLSDRPGKYTFMSDNGCSTIDLVWANTHGIFHIVDMEVCDFIVSSDHFPVAVHTNLILDRQSLPRGGRSENTRLKWSRDKEVLYRATLDSYPDLHTIDFEAESNHLYYEFVKAIYEVSTNLNMLKSNNEIYYPKNKPWFDLECNRSKRDVRRLYRKAKKKNFDQESVKMFLLEKKNYKCTLRTKKATYINKMKERLKQVKNPQEFWIAVKHFKFNIPIRDSIDLENWEAFLISRYSLAIADNKIVQDALHPFLDRKIDMNELSIAIKFSKNNKSPGPDGIQYEFYKALPLVWKKYLLDLFNKVIESENIPAEWSKIKMLFIYKKGDKANPCNYRGIALINCISKIFTGILEKRLTCWCESGNLLPESQSGFRKNRSCTDNVFVLHSLIYQQVQFYKKSLYALFVDFESAFDSVPHSKLWLKLGEIGVSSRVIRLFSSLYSNATIVVERGGQSTNPIKVSKGLLQGDSASPLLFSLYISDIELYFRKKGHHGIPVNNEIDILLLMFADDIVILADSPSDMKNKLVTLNQYCREKMLKVNVNKTKIVNFHRGRPKRNVKFFFDKKEIEISKFYKYLGVEFHATGNFKKFCHSVINKNKVIGEQIINILRTAKSDLWESKMKLYESVFLPSLLYESEVWGVSSEELIEKAQMYFLKRILLLDKGTPNWAIRLETGRIKLGHLIFRRGLSWLEKMLGMTNNRFPRICFLKLADMSSTRVAAIGGSDTNWVSLMKSQFCMAGFETYWERALSTTGVLQRIHGEVVDAHHKALQIRDRQRALDSNTFNGYKFWNSALTVGEQLIGELPFTKVRCVSQLRTATNRSMYLHVGRLHVWIDCTKQCPLCNLREKETVGHFLVKCPMYNDIRAIYIARYMENIAREIGQLTVLLSNFDKNKMNRLYLYTCKAIEIRNFIIEAAS